MRKHVVRNNRSFVIPLISLFLFFLAVGLFAYQLYKAKEVVAVAGVLTIQSTTGTVNFAGGTWDSSGNVGIGTTSPTVKLDVVGGLNITGNTNICTLVTYTATSDITYCPTGYYTWSATGLTTGTMLCCKVSNPI